MPSSLSSVFNQGLNDEHSIAEFVVDFYAKSVSAGQENFFRSDYILVPALNSWLKFHREPLPWHLARRRCEYEGSKLGMPVNNEYVTMFKEMMSTYNVSALYTGVHATFGRGDYFSIDGKPFSGQHMWRRDGLKYSREARCVTLDSNDQLESVSCDDDYPFICAKKFVHLKITECGTTDPAYTLDKSTGSCYKLHRERKDWNTAVSVCTAEGGYLAIPSDASEAQLLAEMAIEDETYIGYLNWEDEEWYTVHGEPITYSYNIWVGPMPPDNMKNCGAIEKGSAVLRILYCNAEKPFICEKNVDSLLLHNRNPHDEVSNNNK